MEKLAFAIIGTQKSGSTTLAYQMAQHPKVDFCKHKEPDFFSKRDDWKSSLSEYDALFQNQSGLVKGEASTTYTWYLEYPEVPQRLREYNPDIKLIVILRNPVDRLISHYTHHMLKGRTRIPIEEEVLKDPTYINHSMYNLQLKPYLDLFDKEQIKLVIFEEYVKDPLPIVNDLFEFIEIDTLNDTDVDLKPQYSSLDRTGDTRLKTFLTPLAQALFPVKVRNALRKPFVYKMKEKVTISEDFRAYLYRYFEDDINALEGNFSLDLSHWKVK